MPTDRKYPTVWEALHPGEPLPTKEEFRAMRERSIAYWSKRFEEDPSLYEAMRRKCSIPGCDCQDE